MMERRYWPLVEPKELPARIREKIKERQDEDGATGRSEKIARVVRAYYGSNATGTADSTGVEIVGRQGEVLLAVENHLRSLVDHVLTLTTQNRPAFEALARNTDSNSLRAAKLAEAVLEAYMTDGAEAHAVEATEQALVGGDGWLAVTWDPNAGEVVGTSNVPGPDGAIVERPVHEGDVQFRALGAFEVVTPEHGKAEAPPWAITITYENAWDLAVSYPELHDEILGAAGRQDQLVPDWCRSKTDKDAVQVLTLYHASTRAVPGGIFARVVGDHVLGVPIALPYKDGIPLIRMQPKRWLGQVGGYSSAWDLVGLQEALNGTLSSTLTNYDAATAATILAPFASNAKFSAIKAGLNMLYYDATAAEPKVLDLTRLSDSSFKLREQLIDGMQTISGINSVARGNPQASLKSGTSLAMVQAMAIQYNSGIQRAYAWLLRALGNKILEIVKTFVTNERLVEITGLTNKTTIERYKADSFKAVRRVKVEVGNPLMRTMAWRQQTAESWLEQGLIKTPAEFVTVVRTGNTGPVEDPLIASVTGYIAENEALMRGEPVEPIVTEDHAEHVRWHMTTLLDPDTRKDPVIVKTVLEHIGKHQAMMAPPPPGPGAPPPPGPGAPPPPEIQGVERANVPAATEGPGAAMAEGELPAMPRNPLTGEQATV